METQKIKNIIQSLEGAIEEELRELKEYKEYATYLAKQNQELKEEILVLRESLKRRA